MRIIYYDSDFHCHITNPDGVFNEFETDFFNGKCTKFIEGYMYIPKDESWIRSDGVEFLGEMIAPWRPYLELAAAQQEYERQQLADYEAALSEIETALGVTA